MYIVNINDNNGSETISISKTMRLDKLMKELDLMLDMPCSGNHTCGKCKVTVKGHLSEMTDEERMLLKDEEIKNNIRLACFAEVNGDIEIFLDQTEANVLSMVKQGDLEFTEEGYGISVDIGTTTVAMQLYELRTGKLLGEDLRNNAQCIFGADVISRIKYATENGTKYLQDSIHKQLLDMSKECMHKAEIYEINKSVVTGNTVMLHFYEGLETRSIAVAPFKTESLFGRNGDFELSGSQTYLPSCIGSYVGADISCSILAAGMQRHNDRIELLADLGTNGELVLNYRGEMYCASTAAGPAFEGANLSHGMRAELGAISEMMVDDGKVLFKVIGNGKPKGVCGSGVLDAVSVMLELGVINETGRIDEGYIGDGEVAWKIPSTEVYITQKDIRQIQLAKSAIFAGIKTLLDQAGLKEKDIETFYVAGGFGYHMNGENAANIGLFPRGLERCMEVIGNGALSGAIMLLFDNKQKEYIKEIINKSTEVDLSGKQVFSDYYIEGMLFEEDEKY
ncbi:MAG TPA: ASKHA domain-containing protein [Anaerovoracaceae bacterium]|nr:ASKHA domain-containing protein [Anaerovoracaceae bacterium]